MKVMGTFHGEKFGTPNHKQFLLLPQRRRQNKSRQKKALISRQEYFLKKKENKVLKSVDVLLLYLYNSSVVAVGMIQCTTKEHHEAFVLSFFILLIDWLICGKQRLFTYLTTTLTFKFEREESMT
jgi:hypothetical protein